MADNQNSLLYNGSSGDNLPSLNGTQTADGTVISLFPKGNDTKSNLLQGLAAQQIQSQVQKSVKPVYEIGTAKYYLIDGRSNGQGTIQYLFGPSTNVINSIKIFSSVCQPCTLKYDVYPSDTSCKKGSANTVMFVDGTLTSFGMTATSQDFMVTGQIGFVFMDVQTTTSTNNNTNKKASNSK